MVSKIGGSISNKIFRIGIDSHAVTGEGNGNSTYYKNLLLEIPKVNYNAEYVYYTGIRNTFYKEFDMIRGISIEELFLKSGIGRTLFSLPVSSVTDNLDLLHVQYHTPIYSKCPVVVTIHDICFEHFPEYYSKLHLLLSKYYVKWSSKTAAKIITVSNYSAMDIQKKYGIPDDKIAVIHNGVDKSFQPIYPRTVREELKKRYNAVEGFVLFVGRTDDPRKNLLRLINAFAELKKNNSVKQKLILVGKIGNHTEELKKNCVDLRIADDVQFLGVIPVSEIILLMATADLFVYPSLFEGFGLPVLEAMSCGTPVVASNNTSIPEVVGDAGILVNPCDIRELVIAMQTILCDRRVAQRLSQSGINRAKTFSWEAAARKTIQVYESLLK